MIVDMINRPSVVDFEAELRIYRTTVNGDPTEALLYDWVYVIRDTADNSERLEDWGEACWPSEIVYQIEKFVSTDEELKHAVELVLKNDELTLIDEF